MFVSIFVSQKNRYKKNRGRRRQRKPGLNRSGFSGTGNREQESTKIDKMIQMNYYYFIEKQEKYA
jgi:hypothetical protein